MKRWIVKAKKVLGQAFCLSDPSSSHNPPQRDDPEFEPVVPGSILFLAGSPVWPQMDEHPNVGQSDEVCILYVPVPSLVKSV